MKNPEFRNPKRTICEVHRELWRTLEKVEIPEREQLLALLDEAYLMGKKMDKKLKEYKHGSRDND